MDVHEDRVGHHIHLDNRHENALVALYTTGSAIGEATHISVNLTSPGVSVVQSGALTVTATDDYGQPATNATVALSGTDTGNARVPSAFSAAASTTLTDGKATVALRDHSAETVALSYTVQDGTYHDARDTTTGTASEAFTPGPTAAIHTNVPTTATVGTTTPVNGDAEDQFGNAVSDGTNIAVSATNGTISGLTATSGGNFAFVYNAPKTKGTDGLTLKAADSNYTVNATVSDHADHPASITPKTQTATAGQAATLAFQVFDLYQNLVEDGEALSLNLGDGSNA